MWDVTHAAVALAGMTLIPGVARAAERGNPAPVLLGVACALLPNLLERVRRRLCPADVTVAVDPLQPTADALAEGVAAAAFQAYRTQTARTVRLLPLPGAGQGGLRRGEPWVRLDVADRRLQAGLEPGAATAQRPLPPLQAGWPCLYRCAPLDGLLLRFLPGSPEDARIRCVPIERGWPHGPALLGVVAAAAFLLLETRFALGVTVAIGSHHLLDQGGLVGVAWGWRLPRRVVEPPGWRLWSERTVGANVSATWLAVLVTFWNLARETDYLPWRPHWLTLLLLGYALPWLALRLVRRAGDAGRG